MKSPLTIITGILCFVFLAVSAGADYLVVSRVSNIKERPERDSLVLEKVETNTPLHLLDQGQQDKGYYHVKTTNNSRDGWIYRNHVRRKTGNPPVEGESTREDIGELINPLCLYGCPAGSPTSNDVVTREIYVLSNNPRTKFADWVAYKVTKETIGPSKNRNWAKDPLLDVKVTMEPHDYDGAPEALKIDRGHQAPLASFSGTSHWMETNYLSNITPQKSNLNQGLWEKLEENERKVAKRDTVKEIYVMTGPLYERSMPKMPNASKDHVVPSAYWKVIAVNDGKVPRVAAFYFDQETSRNEDMCDHLQTIDEIERRSGLDFFYTLDDALEDSMECSTATLAGDLGCQEN